MGLKGASRTAWAALFITLILVASTPGVANLQNTPGLADAASQDVDTQEPAVPGLDEAAFEQEPPSATDLRGANPQADLKGWLEWSQKAPLPLLMEQARHLAPETGQQIVPAPDAFPGHDGLDKEKQRDAWRSWWLATEIGAMRSPTTGGNGWSLEAESGSYQEEPTSDTQEIRSPFGDPHSLDQLWRLQVHGPPRILLPAGPGDETYLVTDRGVLFLPSPGAAPDWMLHVEGIAGHAEVIEKEGRYDLVVGIHSLQLDAGSPSIWVIDGDAEEIRFSGLSGEKAMLQWTMSDVDQDGEKDILGVDASGNATAVRLDGSEIYRTALPEAEEIPTSEDVPELPEGIDQWIAIVMQRTGMESFGDATGDGVKDIFTTSLWGPAPLNTAMVVSLVDGSDGTAVWTHVLEPAPDAIWRLAMPTATGDLNGDGLADVNIFDYYWGFFFGGTNLYLSGAEGLILAQDDPRIPKVNMNGGITFNGFSYLPLGFLDLNGDGTLQIVAIEAEPFPNGDRWDIAFRPNIEIRTILPTPGGPTVLEESFRINDMPYSMLSRWVQHTIVEDGDKQSLMLLFPHFLTPPDHYGHLVTVDENGISSSEPPQPIGHFAVNQQTGQRYAWLLQNDRYTPVDAELNPAGNGTRLILSATPILTHDEDQDGTPDLLIRRSMGYFWISGKTGRILDSVDRPMGSYFRMASLHDDSHVLESDADHYILFDVVKRETVATISRNIEDGSANPVALGDFTGDGRLEILLRVYGHVTTYCDPEGCTTVFQDDEWLVYSPLDPGLVWKAGTDMGVGFFGELVDDRAGVQLLIIEWDGDESNVTAYAPTKGGDGILWNRQFDYIDHYGAWNTRPQIKDGHLAFWEQAMEGDRVVVLDGKSGETLRSLPFEGGQLVWIRLVDGKGAPYLVSSVLEGNQDRRRQYVTAADLASGDVVTTFRMLDPIVHTTTFQGFGGTYTAYTPVVNQPGPSVGDWDRDGHPDLALVERNWPVVRSLKDGEPIAVGPTFGRFTFTEDLNRDGRQEIAMDAGGSLRMYSFDPSIGSLDQEDPLSRVETVDPDDTGDNETVHHFFEPEDEKSPGPAVLIVPVVLGLLIAAVRRRATRR